MSQSQVWNVLPSTPLIMQSERKVVETFVISLVLTNLVNSRGKLEQYFLVKPRHIARRILQILLKIINLSQIFN